MIDADRGPLESVNANKRNRLVSLPSIRENEMNVIDFCDARLSSLATGYSTGTRWHDQQVTQRDIRK